MNAKAEGVTVTNTPSARIPGAPTAASVSRATTGLAGYVKVGTYVTYLRSLKSKTNIFVG